MGNRTTHVIALLACAAMLASGAAAAQARQPPPQWRDPSGPPTEPDVWLRRLVDTYRVEGAIQVVRSSQADQSQITGTADCVGIGTGPGVQCILDLKWQDIYEIIFPSEDERGGVFALPGGVSYLNPSMVLFGLDPGRSGIDYLLVDNKGLPEGGLGSTGGNRATFKTPCVNAPTLLAAMKPPPVPPEPPEYDTSWQTCDRIIRIDARPGSTVVHWSMDIEINGVPYTRFELTFRRVARVQADGKS